MKFKPHEYQKYVIQQIIEKKRLAVFLEMGLGKTVSTLCAIDYLMNDTLEINKVLIIAPLKVAKLTWEEEIQKYDELNHLRLSKIVGSAKARIKAINTPSDIYIVNRENTKWLIDYFQAEKRWPYQMLVIDESSSFKNRASQRFKAAKIMAYVTPRVVELSGTPVPNGLMDLWAQIYLLDQGKRLGATITAYRETYFVPDKRNRQTIFSWRPRTFGEELIFEKIKDISLSMKAVDHIEMPERVDNIIKLTMPPAIRKLYEQMEHEYLITIDEETIMAGSAGVVCNKLLQMANGAVYKENHEWILIHNLKLQALEEILEANEGKPVMVLYNFNHDRDRLLEYFKDRNPVILASDEDKRKWDKKEIPLLLAHPASMGHGLNLQAGGNIIVWFGLTNNLEYYLQANARLYRQGQTETVIINHLVVEGTEDINTMRRLATKKTTQDELIAAVKAKVRAAKRRDQ